MLETDDPKIQFIPDGADTDFTIGVLDDGGDDDVNDIFVDRTGVTWIGTWDGLSRLTPHFDAIQLAPHAEASCGLLKQTAYVGD